MNNYISVIGAGSWGTALAALLAEKGYDVALWARRPDLAHEINKEAMNSVYLPGVKLPPSLKATSSLRDAVSGTHFIVSVVPTQFIRPVFSQVSARIRNDAVIVSASKGIEIDTLLTPSMVLREVINRPVSVLSGPSFADEVITKRPTAITLASEDRKTGLILQEIFDTDYFRVYTHDDMTGVEMGGALKNVIAIAAGISEGLGLGHNSRAALITRGLAEIRRLGLGMGAHEVTFSGLSGLGDLVLTCTARLSRNYTVGYKLGQGMSIEDITGQTRSVAEGITTTLSARQLSKKQNIDMPITEQVYLTLYENKPPIEAVRDLMTRSLKSEFYSY
ncbi:MAG: NAD(P)-dependent glycerol-3-phosphate dehydrogenase [Nitrospirales bacterium]|nr:NAD(P)-dependent glycerol-3-phosphate dehydrogenase [Nitrospirales bacterium]